MGGDDDLPDYLRGVEQSFDADDNYTLKPDRAAPLSASGYDLYGDAEDDEEDDDERRPSGPGVTGVLGLIAGCGGLVFATLVLAGASLAAYATVVNGAQIEAEEAGAALVRTVDAQKKVVTELGARGGDRGELERLLADVESAQGFEQSLAALEFTHAVQKQIVGIGDLRQTPIAKRQTALDRAQDHFEHKLAGWQGSAGNPLGQAAVALGLANAAP